MNDSNFDDFLKNAKADVHLSASFKHGVWRRLENEESEAHRVIVWFHAFAANFVRPWGAAAGVAATVVLGLWLGSASVPGTHGTKDAYTQSISPFDHATRK